MKKLFLSVVALFAVMTIQAQKNVEKVTTTTVKTVNDGTAPKSVVKTEVDEKVQDIKLKDKTESLNKKKDMDAQVETVESSSTVAYLTSENPLKTKLNESVFYTLNGKKYQFVTRQSGFKVSTDENPHFAFLKKTGQNEYVYETENSKAVGHFDEKGNFVVDRSVKMSDGTTDITYTFVKQ
ncbi:hypothetical protein [Flavobacterium kingsejongi]|uniref:Uncharacterized protein n=1 Tax=Flavobacterium kingsejongi TaxID=1678728 RepID=A0A2S1LSC8_9FLAO|nr:hypothetical protein [Flavobacterium kingsejongi]AWG26667.1 hypothetical protein FK004_16260 [Flavobacterium kingsejongi]